MIISAMRRFLAVIRLVSFTSMTLGLYALWFVLSPFKTNRVRWREWIFGTWAKGFIKIAGARLKIQGTPPNAPFLLVSNHLTYFDVAVLRAACRCVFVAKADIRGWAVAGRIVRDMGAIFINRENRRDIPRAGEEITEAIDRGEGVVVFAEGTTSDGSAILPLKSSFLEFAAAADLPVYFAAIHYATAENQPKASQSVCWVGDEVGFVEHILKFFELGSFDVVVTFGAQPQNAPNRKLLTAQLQHSLNEIFTPID